jgi:hypothetical protein
MAKGVADGGTNRDTCGAVHEVAKEVFSLFINVNVKD